MKFDLFKITSIGYLIMALMGCNTVSSPPLSEPATPPSITPIPSDPTQGDSTMPPNLSTPAAAGPANLIEQAKADLAQRLAISVNEINLIDATAVTWPDSSLGCPQEGMAYAQVLTPGYLILLEHGGNTFEYHASRADSIITCENPSPPVPGDPANT